MLYSDCLIVVSVSFISAVVSELISYVLIYRTDEYQKLKKTIDILSKKMDKKKDGLYSNVSGKQKKQEKKISQMDEHLKLKQREMSMVKFKSMFFVGATLMGVLGLLTNLFDGQPVAKLPFTPISMIRGLSHRNLPGTDYTDCSMVFLYMLCSLSIKSNVQKFFGWAPAKTATLFPPPEAGQQSPW